MSGAAEAFDELEGDIEDIRVLTFDGSSARLLDYLLTPFAVVPGVSLCVTLSSSYSCSPLPCLQGFSTP